MFNVFFYCFCKIKMKLLLLLIILIPIFTNAQGGSDTNVSMYGSLAPNFKEIKDHLSIETHLRIDEGKNNVISIAPYLCVDANVNSSLNFQFWFSSKYANGDLINDFSFGDVAFVGTYAFNYDSKSRFKNYLDFGLSLSIENGRGVKEEQDNFYTTYPMEYQASLGTLDVFVSYSLKIDNMNFSLGFQQPLSSKNQNNFFPTYFDLGDINENYPASNEMRRSGDLFSRIGYSFFENSRDFYLNLGASIFYRLKNDEYFVLYKNDFYPNKGYNEVDGTKGLAVNGVIQFIYKLSNRAEISLYAGLPLVERKENIDGLKRNYFLTPGFKWNF